MKATGPFAPFIGNPEHLLGQLTALLYKTLGLSQLPVL
ncbi:hypothetical protein CYFUS_008382 [Cystobacter fuscus]|uniref:Uncharacterized protein n=1 Tax=Cystobacter fuscus TaxID=43 RepID=A0A250JH03_9BACT|nr:hypothetical protein CYFUS_008382 [Cystobacter fuscus]